MTRNQIDFLRLQEERRSNEAREVELHRTNTENERIKQLDSDRSYRLGSKNLSESRRHNVVTESQDMLKFNRSQSETERHNLATEANEARKAAASERSADASMAHAGAAYAQVQLGRQQLAALDAREANALMEQRTHNRNVEAETIRANRNREIIDQQRADAYTQMAGSDRMQVQTGIASQAETQRHNLVSEGQKAVELQIGRDNATANMLNSINGVTKTFVPLIIN